MSASSHDAAMRKPRPNERPVVVLIQTAHDLIADGSTEYDERVREGTILILRAAECLLDGDIGRLEPTLVQDFIDHAYRQLNTETLERG